MSSIYDINNKIHNFIPLVCDGLVIRKYTLEDAKLFYRYTSDVEISRYMVCGTLRSYDEACRLIRQILYRYNVTRVTKFVIADRQTNRLMGCLSIYLKSDKRTVEIGYWLGQEYWGKGYMTNILNTLITQLMHISELRRIYIEVDANNIASLKVAHKVGFKHNGELPREVNGRQILTFQILF